MAGFLVISMFVRRHRKVLLLVMGILAVFLYRNGTLSRPGQPELAQARSPTEKHRSAAYYSSAQIKFYSDEVLVDPAEVFAHQNGTPEESKAGALLLLKQYVDTGKVVFRNADMNGSCHARNDFIAQTQQLRPPSINRVPGQSLGYFPPSMWAGVAAIANEFERRHTAKPYVEVWCLASDHRLNPTGQSNKSPHVLDVGMDLSVLGGWRVSGQHTGDNVSVAIKALWNAGIYPPQLISFHGRGGFSDVVNPAIYGSICGNANNCGAFLMSDHGDHLHITFR